MAGTTKVFRRPEAPGEEPLHGEDWDAGFFFERKHLGGLGHLLRIFPGVPLLLLRLSTTLALASVLVPALFIAAKLGSRSCVCGLMQFISRTLLFLFGFIWISTDGEKADVPQEGCVIVSNHIGVAEIMWLMYIYGPAFVARKEYRHLPVAGSIGEHLDFIFVDPDRGSKESKEKGDSNVVQNFFVDGASTGRCLCIFPEGTTSNGKGVLSFRTGAFLPKVLVLPHAVSHTIYDGLQMDPHFSGGALHWHLLGLMCNVWNEMHVEYLDPVPYDIGRQPQKTREEVRQAIAEALDVALVDANYKDKVAYEIRAGLRKPQDPARASGETSCRLVGDE